jgi:hypothetical protein
MCVVESRFISVVLWLDIFLAEAGSLAGLTFAECATEAIMLYSV